MEQLSDQELIRQALSGDQASYALLVTRYQRAVYAVARRMLRDHDAADDVAQETFVKAWFSLRGYDDRFRFYTWLVSIATNLCYDALRRDRRRSPLDEAAEQSSGDDPLEAAVQGDACTRIRDAVDGLPREQRDVVLLRVDRELSYQEIGAALNIPVGTVMSRLFRARKALHEKLKDPS